jgi:carboxyl-terminal processing protease
MRTHRFVVSLLLAALLFSSSVYGKVMPVEFDSGRNRLIAYMLSHQLSAQHFDHKPFGEKMSKAAYDLYIKQLDPRKQFLLATDIRYLSKFSDKIDDELSAGRISLPDVGMKLLNKRAEEVVRLVKEIMDADFSPNRKDYLQTDPEKSKSPYNISELKDKWRRSLKMEVLDSYLDELEKENKKRKKEEKALLSIQGGQVDKTIWTTAMEKVLKKTDNYLNRLQKVTRQEHYNRFFDVIARCFYPNTIYMDPT